MKMPIKLSGNRTKDLVPFAFVTKALEDVLSLGNQFVSNFGIS